MHPIVADRRRLAVYLLAWLMLATLLAFALAERGAAALAAALRITLPPTLAYALVCLAAWYPVRALPLRASRAWQLALTHAIAALFLGGLFLALFRISAIVLGAGEGVAGRAAVIVITGALLYLLAVAFHYLLVAAEEEHRLERREIEVKVLAREAELKALKAQIDPHFLFNSLNSINSLCGSNPASARTLTTLLADYLRRTLRIGGSETITLSEELELASAYLAIERIRFGPRLDVEQSIDEGTRMMRVPPLLLQPLVENAVTHGIAHLIDGGVVRIAAMRNGSQVVISVENPRDPDSSSRPGHGIGLENTRRRMETFYSGEARVGIVEEPDRFRVELHLPG